MNLVKLAKNGDIKAVSKLINYALNPQNIRAKVRVNHDQIIVVLESTKKLNQTKITNYIYKGLIKLEVTNYSNLVIYGKYPHTKNIDWHKKINLGLDSKARESKLENIQQQETKQLAYPTVPANPNAKGAIIPLHKKSDILAVLQSAQYLQNISNMMLLFFWVVIIIQLLFILSILYDLFISRSQLLYTIINLTDITGILSSWLEQLLYLIYQFWDLLKSLQSSLERIIYLLLIIWVYFLINTIKKIYNNYPVTPWKSVIYFSIPVYNLWGLWDVLSKLSIYLIRQEGEVAKKGQQLKQSLPWLYIFIFSYFLLYMIYLIYATLGRDKYIISYLDLLVDIMLICRSIFYLQIIKISYEGVLLHSIFFKNKFLRM